MLWASCTSHELSCTKYEELFLRCQQDKRVPRGHSEQRPQAKVRSIVPPPSYLKWRAELNNLLKLQGHLLLRSEEFVRELHPMEDANACTSDDQSPNQQARVCVKARGVVASQEDQQRHDHGGAGPQEICSYVEESGEHVDCATAVAFTLASPERPQRDQVEDDAPNAEAQCDPPPC